MLMVKSCNLFSYKLSDAAIGYGVGLKHSQDIRERLDTTSSYSDYN